MKKKCKILISVFLPSFILIFIILSYHQVDNALTKEDKEYIKKILEEMDVPPLSNPINYENEIQFIIEIQKSILELAPDNIGIPYSQKREPKNLYIAKKGLCYDRSRVIEKILRYKGFQTRHISIYSKEHTKSSFKSLITPKTGSHAVTEVLTLKGWLVIDSNDFWISIGEKGMPVSIEQIHSDVGRGNIIWENALPSAIYKKSFTFVYGLYSRHGKFYPPYNLIPDINYKEFIQNVF